MAVGAVAVLGAACARPTDRPGNGDGIPTGPTAPSPSPVTPGISHPAGPNELILKIEQTGGFVPAEYLLARLPSFALYGDGTLLTLGAQTEIYPQPALPPVLVQHLTEDGIQRILELAEEAGLLAHDAMYMNHCVADVTTTVFTVVADGGKHVVSAYALGFDEGKNNPCVPEEQREARKALVEFEAQIADLSKSLPAGSYDDPQPWDPTGLRLYVTEGSPATDPGLEEPEVAWPLDEPLAQFGAPYGENGTPGFGTRCGTVEGEDLATLLPSVRQATQITPWTSGGKTYGILFRPLYPDESGCPAF
jgi:hypothetical protein